jgi:predicted metalloprotease with PDZ domain
MRKPFLLSAFTPTLLAATVALSFGGNALAQAQPPSSPRAIPAPQEVPYAGTLQLDVDLTDLDHRVMQVRETLPVKPGPLTLLYPHWLPGAHNPGGSVSKLAGLQITANGTPLEWKRDTLDVYAFHVDVPAGVSTLDLSYQYLSPITQANGRVVMTPEIIGLQWISVLLYPAGHASDSIQVQANAKLPAGWQTGTALDVAKRDGDHVAFKPLSLERLVDSPMWAGKYTKRIALDETPGKAPVYLNLFADAPSSLDAQPEHIAAHKALIQQTDKLYGSRHFARYEFLLAMSENFSGIGLEHSESSENGVGLTYFTEWKKNSLGRDLLSHEMTHSWNGKYRRPADLSTPNLNVPMQDSLLWVYEGQTQYWGHVLAARSGLVPLQDALDSLAYTAAGENARAGRQWRNLQDTTNEPIISQRSHLDWGDWQRREEYYVEGQLVWLDADTKIRELSKGAKSLNDVAKAFFGVEDGRVKVLTYTFDDYVKALNAVAPYDWAGFLRQRLDGHSNANLLDGITRGGWKLTFTDKQSEYGKAMEMGRRGNTDFSYSLGFDLDHDGKLSNLKWGGPAFKAGMTASMQLLAVNGYAYKAEGLREAITHAKDGSGIELLVKFENRYRTFKIDYRDGQRYPKLERVADKPDLLTAILSPMK